MMCRIFQIPREVLVALLLALEDLGGPSAGRSPMTYQVALMPSGKPPVLQHPAPLCQKTRRSRQRRTTTMLRKNCYQPPALGYAQHLARHRSSSLPSVVQELGLWRQEPLKVVLHWEHQEVVAHRCAYVGHSVLPQLSGWPPNRHNESLPRRAG